MPAWRPASRGLSAARAGPAGNPGGLSCWRARVALARVIRGFRRAFCSRATLTEVGELLLPLARRMLGLADEMRTLLARMRETVRATVDFSKPSPLW